MKPGVWCEEGWGWGEGVIWDGRINVHIAEADYFKSCFFKVWANENTALTFKIFGFFLITFSPIKTKQNQKIKGEKIKTFKFKLSKQ